MAIGHQPVRERIVLPKRQGVPLAHVLEGEEDFPFDTQAFLYLYDVSDVELAFWPLTVDGADILIDIDGAEWWPYRDARSFSVFVVYSEEPAKKWNWFEGAVLRTV